MLINCPNCALVVANTETICPLRGSSLAGAKTHRKSNSIALRFLGGLFIGCLALGALVFGSIGTCLTTSFIKALPPDFSKSASGYFNTAITAAMAFSVAGLFIVGIWGVLKTLKNLDE